MVIVCGVFVGTAEGHASQVAAGPRDEVLADCAARQVMGNRLSV